MYILKYLLVFTLFSTAQNKSALDLSRGETVVAASGTGVVLFGAVTRITGLRQAAGLEGIQKALLNNTSLNPVQRQALLGASLSVTAENGRITITETFRDLSDVEAFERGVRRGKSLFALGPEKDIIDSLKASVKSRSKNIMLMGATAVLGVFTQAIISDHSTSQTSDDMKLEPVAADPATPSTQ